MVCGILLTANPIAISCFFLMQPWIYWEMVGGGAGYEGQARALVHLVLEEMMSPPRGHFGNYRGKFVFIFGLSTGSQEDSIAPSKAFWKFVGTFLGTTIMRGCYWL